MKIVGRIASWLLTLVIIAASALVLLFVVLPLFNYQPYIVLSGSMEPVVHTGAVTVINKNDTDISEGDIIAYQLNDDVAVTHRVIAIDENNRYITKGDANDIVDFTPIEQSQIIGTYAFQVPGLGYAIADLEKHPILLVPVGSGIAILLILANAFDTDDKKKKTRRRKR